MLPAWLTALIGMLLPPLIDGFLGRRLDAAEEAARDQMNKNAGANEAANATLSTIGAIAGERADLPDIPADDAALIARLRARAARDRVKP